MHVDSIDAALDRDDIRAIEGAFRALVDFPHEGQIAGADTVETLCNLLDRVVWALQLNQSAMPSATCRVIANVLHEPISNKATYAHGAKVVSDYSDRWRELFLIHIIQDGDNR